MEVTLNLSPSLFERIILRASLKRQDIAQAATTMLEAKDSSDPIMLPIDSLPDKEVMELTHARMDEKQDERLSVLLVRQRESVITAEEIEEMNALMRVHDQLWRYQTEALVEAVKRGLRPPLTN